MIDMNKVVVFRDGWTLDGVRLTDRIRGNAFEVIELGYRYGLTLEQFYHDDEEIFFEWRGTKRALSAWWLYYSRIHLRHSKEEVLRVLEVIRAK